MNRVQRGLLITALLFCLVPLVSFAGGQGEGAAPQAESKVTIHMFMGNSGLAHPVDVDPSDNWAINIVEKYANVDLILEVPNYQQFATKFRLLLASGNLPDIVHSWLRADFELAADAGAFIDLEPYYNKSPQMQKVVSRLAFDLAKTPKGLHYAIPMVMSSREPGWGNFLRYDLLREYNGGKFPTNVEGYVDFVRWVKKTYPDSIPLSSRRAWGDRLFVVSDTFFVWYGVPPYGTRIQNGKVYHNFTLPAMKEALKLWQKLYKEGLLDPEFATSDTSQFYQKVREKKVCMMTNATDQVLPTLDSNLKNGLEWVYTPLLKEYPAALTDVKYTMGTDIFPISGHRTAIASSSKLKDRAWRVLEGFASDELWDAISWGREGKEYVIKNGKRVPTDRLYYNDRNDPDSHYWTLHLGIIRGFWPTKVKYEVQRMRNPVEFDRLYKSNRYLVEWARKIGQSYGPFIPTNPDVAKKSGEINPFLSSVYAKVIMGQMSWDEFDQKVAEFKKTFGFIYDYQTKYIQEHKDELRAKNVKMVDW